MSILTEPVPGSRSQTRRTEEERWKGREKYFASPSALLSVPLIRHRPSFPKLCQTADTVDDKSLDPSLAKQKDQNSPDRAVNGARFAVSLLGAFRASPNSAYDSSSAGRDCIGKSCERANYSRHSLNPTLESQTAAARET
jgi:hypothetical protein